MSHKYNMNDSLWYCGGPDRPVLNVFINGYMHDDTPGGIPRYLVHCDTALLAEEVPILESDLYRTELEAQDAKCAMLRRRGDALRRQVIENDDKISRQAAIVSQLVARGSKSGSTINEVTQRYGHYQKLTVGSNGNLSLESGAIVDVLQLDSGGYCYVHGGAIVSSAKVHEGHLVIVGGRVGRGYMDHVSGRIEVCFSGEANHIAISAGIMYVAAGLVDCVDVSSGALVLDSPHASARGVCVEGSDAQFRLCAGTATCVDVSKGYIQVATGASVQNLTVKSGGIVEHLLR